MEKPEVTGITQTIHSPWILNHFLNGGATQLLYLGEGQSRILALGWA
jgi:hypothetical protein